MLEGRIQILSEVADKMATVWESARRYLTVSEFKKGIPIKVAYVLMQQADMLMTNFAMSAGFHEVNPLIRGILGSPSELLVVKLLVPVIIAWLVPAKLLIPAIGVLLVVLALNLHALSSLL